MKKTIKDIARECGVSIATVSRVLNGSPLARASTRDRVLGVIRRHGFRPNPAARGLAGGRSDLISVIIPPGPELLSADYFHQILNGVTESLAGKDRRLMIYQPAGYQPRVGYTDPSDLAGLQLGGVILLASLKKDLLVKHLEAAGTPAVLVLARSPKLDWVDLDNVRSAAQAVEALAGMGHRRIAHIAGVPGKGNTLDRVKGYRRALKAAGLPFDPRLVIEGNFKMDGGSAAARKLLALRPRPTAVFAANDLMAAGAVMALKEAGLRVPEDVSVFGFDDVDAAALCKPPLSTVRQPFRKMGRVACDMLLARMTSPRLPPRAVEYQGEVVMRESCARAG